MKNALPFVNPLSNLSVLKLIYYIILRLTGIVKERRFAPYAKSRKDTNNGRFCDKMFSAQYSEVGKGQKKVAFIGCAIRIASV